MGVTLSLKLLKDGALRTLFGIEFQNFDENQNIYMRNYEMKQVHSVTHLGIIRSSSTQKKAKPLHRKQLK